jgi:DNA-binding GntR family transcriptional regulator
VFESAESESLATRAYRQLEELIVTLVLPPGMLLSEADLSQRLGLGRTPVREALIRLQRDHMVDVMPRRGVRVAEVHVGQQLLLVEARRALERVLAAGAARRASKHDRTELVRVAQEIELVGRDGDEFHFLRLDREFNEIVLRAARNPFAAAALEPLNALSRRFWYLHFRDEHDLPTAAAVHANMAHAIADGDEGMALAAVDDLLDWVESFTRATMAT